ncbi:hypothetical protein UFOVP109_12 [uncultured Caudovirales phage]|uniref:Tail completion protein n=1 Tax=uncultured Caudovirales phage TaxID=2100421 RepID=A0A6J5L3W8_9CAUD|nr:hypothetical protein UFOVP109_12 [uncultured Caudovirales phage]CAB5219063.1 hypothetical protein UFOVP224_25 [uncultured Caudovirales phage]
MRDTILAHLRANVRNLGSFRISDNLPWFDSGQPLYHHNKKHIYVDTANSQQQPVIDTFNLAGTVTEITTVSVYFANDAKKLPSEYSQVVDVIKGARLASGTETYIQRTVSVTNSYVGDDLVTHAEFNFRKLLTN